MLVTVPADSGNAEPVDLDRGDLAIVRIRPDANTGVRQWFHLRVSEVPEGGRLRIVEADRCSYPRGWEDYGAVVSRDRRTWRRAPTTYADGELTIALPEGICWVAAFAPYPLERHRDLVARFAARGLVRSLGTSLDGEDIDVVEVGARQGRPVWILARQHAGEAMAEWFAEGLLERLVDGDDRLVRQVLERARVRVVPNLNPDGTRRGHLRGNAVGTDLNRAWHDPRPDTAPEVLAVRTAMDRHGVALCLDIHGDEAIPYVFASGPSGTPSWDADRATLYQDFLDRWVEADPEVQTEHGYPPNAPGQANLRICTHQVAERYGALSMTIEQPFKDNALRPDPEHGWSPSRARALGRSVLEPIAHVLERLP